MDAVLSKKLTSLRRWFGSAAWSWPLPRSSTARSSWSCSAGRRAPAQASACSVAAAPSASAGGCRQTLPAAASQRCRARPAAGGTLPPKYYGFRETRRTTVFHLLMYECEIKRSRKVPLGVWEIRALTERGNKKYQFLASSCYLIFFIFVLGLHCYI